MHACTSSRAQSPYVPTQIDDWQLVALLGQGRWSQVYQARPNWCPDHWPADYVLKLLKSDEPDEAEIGMLRREACLSALISHPNLVSVLSSRLDGPPYYIVMPFLRGATLREIMESGLQMPVPHALWIARQVADALLALAGQDWIHADVNPSNIFVGVDGHVTLFDLGLALRPAKTASVRSGRPMLGTPAYMPPEMLSPASEIGPHCDVYSLGVTLFEMLTGRRPFAAKDAGGFAEAHLEQSVPDPRLLAPHIPRRVSWLVKRMLAKQPLRRPDTSELISVLVDLEIETFAERLPAA